MKKADSILTWKCEQRVGASTSDDDVGPAWFGSAEATSSFGVSVDGGRWISRGEARAIAEEHGITFFQDDDGPSSPGASPSGVGIDVECMNRALRDAGLHESELRIEEHPGFHDVRVTGTMLQRLPAFQRPDDSPYVTAMVTMEPQRLYEALDLLAPGWRTKMAG
jgi:hypothetical protein